MQVTSFHPHKITFLRVSASGLWFLPPLPEPPACLFHSWRLNSNLPPSILPTLSRTWRSPFRKAPLFWHAGLLKTWLGFLVEGCPVLEVLLQASFAVQRPQGFHLNTQKGQVGHFLKIWACTFRGQDTPRPDSPGNANRGYLLHLLIQILSQSVMTKLVLPYSSSKRSLKRRITNGLHPRTSKSTTCHTSSPRWMGLFYFFFQIFCCWYIKIHCFLFFSITVDIQYYFISVSGLQYNC